MNNPALAYRQFAVQGASPLGLVVMLYDGAIAALERAAAAIEARNVQEKCKHVNKALAIIAQLEGTLNYERGGEVARTLKGLYVHARAQVLKANIEDSAPALRSLVATLMTVREAWNEADRRPASAPPASRQPEAPPGPTPPSSRGPWRMSA